MKCSIKTCHEVVKVKGLSVEEEDGEGLWIPEQALTNH